MDNYNEQHQSLLHEKRSQVVKYKTMSALAWIVAVVVGKVFEDGVKL